MSELDHLLPAVRNADIRFATFTPSGSPFAMIDRRVVVLAPPKLERLATAGEPRALPALIELLRDPERAWAAQVLLSAMTRREEKEVEAFSTDPGAWWETLGTTAHDRWAQWLADRGAHLSWSAADGAFVESDAG
jgi:hypothetical protein